MPVFDQDESSTFVIYRVHLEGHLDKAKIGSDRVSFPILFVKPRLQGGRAKEWVSVLTKTFAVRNSSPRNV